MTHIELVYFDAGGGHRSAAIALQDIIARQNLPWHVQLTNLQELLDPIDVVRKATGIRVQDVYNNMLRNGWTLGSPQLMRVLQAAIRVVHRQTVRLLESYWQGRQPDMVISLVPHFNRALCQSLGNALPGRPFVTILTDIADYPPHFWIERQKQFVICGSDKAVEQARQMGHAGETVFQTSGMILNSRFYEFERIDRDAERRNLGLEASLATGLVLFGGQGSAKMIEIERRLDDSGMAVQLILICGKNAALGQRLRGRRARFPRVVEGFTTNIPYYMQLADFFVGKPGPGSIAEAIALGLPVIVERNSWTLPQERYNTEWVLEKQVGLVVHNFSTIAGAVEELLHPENLSRFRHNAAAMQNRALFEIPDILQTILKVSDNGRLNPGAVRLPTSEARI